MLDIQSYGNLLEGIELGLTLGYSYTVPLVLLKLVSSYGVSIGNLYIQHLCPFFAGVHWVLAAQGNCLDL